MLPIKNYAPNDQNVKLSSLVFRSWLELRTIWITKSGFCSSDVIAIIQLYWGEKEVVHDYFIWESVTSTDPSLSDPLVVLG